MCLVAIAWRAHPRFPLVVAGNRDEHHERPSAPAGWWDDARHVFGGRDLVALGSWLAMSREGRFAVVTNYPGRSIPAADASRGHLVRDFVAGTRPSGRYLDAVAVAQERYAGFCLVVGTQAQLRGFVSPRGGNAQRWTVKPGVAVISNAPLAAPTPKATWLGAAVGDLLAGGTTDIEALFGLLARREPVGPPGEGDGAPIARTPFVAGQRYGTRASTVIRVEANGDCDFAERRFGPGGEPAGESREAFRIT